MATKDSTTVSFSKKCSQCRESFPKTSKYFDKNGKSFRSACKKCRKKTKAQEYRENREKRKRQSRINYHENRARRRETNIIWHAQHPEYKPFYNRKYYKDHRDMLIISAALRCKKRSAVKKSLPYLWDKTFEGYALRLTNDCCLYCGVSINNDLFRLCHFDHIIPMNSKDCPGTVPWNYAPTCGRKNFDGDSPGCNQSKGTKELKAWLTEQWGINKARAVMKRVNRYLENMRKFAQECNPDLGRIA